ncbi:putative quinol monooxygenase [Ancylomarina sp. 16SWW S1-10-2]|uniref:putative quinol monooxygenase n=1 Tax=Ancylomarina sp. 16SWW S1-10-2 TaxID=2499681 RepID=UPI0012AE68C5|nr:putative quinol monooxygenase [Ancylomarina sp. 16SWW S1-10-2]MRT92922.1 antibiotic biosynthesis monooxygenase [Ancylomarina sp. 16SWW S1-10-2]
MSNQKTTIVAKILAKAEKREEVKAELIKLVGFSRSDEGCINYDLHQDKEDENLFFVYENWENHDSLQKHTASKHFVNFIEVTKDSMLITVNELDKIA